MQLSHAFDPKETPQCGFSLDVYKQAGGETLIDNTTKTVVATFSSGILGSTGNHYLYDNVIREIRERANTY